MGLYILQFKDINHSNLPLVGGKAANLGELSKVDGLQVPDGFCITTEAYKKILAETPFAHQLLEQLSTLQADDRHAISELGARIRHAIENTPIPNDISDQILPYETTAYAVRSSATAEDLPSASFAGQQDTYLNIIGKPSILQHISKCWASLFTDRAITYRIQNGFDHRKVQLAVVVQKMVFPQAAGILFTADPVNYNRKVTSIDASFGLGEAMVSGRVNPDIYKVRAGHIIDKKIAAKKLAVYALKEGGTAEQEIHARQQNKQVLTDEQILQLEQTGRKIETHFGSPQDIEWCLADDTIYIVQSRPITTLFPVPETNDDENHVYVSVGHQQMMTDPIKPLGISIWLLTGARAVFKPAGGRLFIDITKGLSSAAGRQNLLDVLGHSDPLIKDALITIIERGDFITINPHENNQGTPIRSHKGMTAADILAEAGDDADIVEKLITSSESSLAGLQHTIQTRSGLEVFDCIREDLQQRTQRTLDHKNLNVIMAAIHASAWINEKINEWLGEKNVADTLTLSVPNNITSEMGMQLLEVADVVRPYPAIIEYLQQAGHQHFLDDLLQFEGGRQVNDAIAAFLDKYGMRCAGEIDITRTRWSENPAILAPMILTNIKNNETGAGKRKFEQGLQEALKKEQDLLNRLRQLPDGEQKAADTKQMIHLLRNYIGYREYPKYDIVSRYFVYKKALLKEAETLVQNGVLHEKEDIYYLFLEELQELIRTQKADYTIINKRKEDYRSYEKLTPPRVITSDGEIITGQYKRENIPAGAIAGLAVSSGVVEGRARVVLKIEDAALEDGDILVTSFTDPSWTPLFVSIAGLVTEVGGLMTHGAVIAREYGLPAVVGVENATKIIKDGQRIRVHGTEGYIELLSK